MMFLVACIVVAIAIGATITLLVRWRLRQIPVNPQPPRSLDPLAPEPAIGGDPHEIRPGYLVGTGAVDNESLLVRGTVNYTQGRYRWSEHYIAAGTKTDPGDQTRRWLEIEDDDEGQPVAFLWAAVQDIGLKPGVHTIEYRGITYELTEHGFADYTTTGATDLPPSGKTEFFDYLNADKDFGLSFERFDNARTWEVSLGELVLPDFLTVYPPSNPAGGIND